MGDIDKNLRRQKPHQEIYRPGSGPLRKSDRFNEDVDSNNRNSNAYKNSSSYSRATNRSNEISDITETLRKITLFNQEGRKPENDLQKDDRKNKRPDNALYVPRPVVEARDGQSKLNNSRSVESQGSNSNVNKKSSKRTDGRRKKFRRGAKDVERPSQERELDVNDDTLRERIDNVEKQSTPAEDKQERYRNRHTEEKLEKEFRNEDHKERYNSNNEQRFSDKPPFHQGRRSSRGGMPFAKFESLPPRFQRLYMEGNAHIFNNSSDENWDASSVSLHKHTEIPVRDYDNVVPKGRGRGRLRANQPNLEVSHPQIMPERFARSLTPERLKGSMNNSLRQVNRAASTEILADNFNSKENSRFGNYERPRRNEERPTRSERSRHEGRSQRNHDKARHDERPQKNEERPVRNNEKVLKNEDYSQRTEEIPSKNGEQFTRNRERSQRNDERHVKMDERLTRDRNDDRHNRKEGKPQRNNGRPGRNDERLPRNYDRPPKNDDQQSRDNENPPENDERFQSAIRSDDRQPRNEERTNRNQERSQRTEERSFRNEDRPQRTEERPLRNEERSHRNDERPSFLPGNEGRSLRNEERRSRNEESLSTLQNSSSPKEENQTIKKEDNSPKNEETLPRRPSGKLYNPDSDTYEEVSSTEKPAFKASEIVLDWAAEVEMCEELDSLDEEPFVFAKPSAPPPLMKQQTFLHQPLMHQPLHHQPPPHHQSSRSKRNRRRSGSRGRNSRRNSVDFGSNNPSRNNSVERGWHDNNWRLRRDEENHSRQSSMDRGDSWSNSLDRRRSRRRRSSERSTGGGGGGGGGGFGSTGGGGGRRRRSSERSGGGGGRRRRSSERSGNGRAPENTNWRLEPRTFEEHPRQEMDQNKYNDSPRNVDSSQNRNSEPSRQRSGDSDNSSKQSESQKPQGILVLPPAHDSASGSPPVSVPNQQNQRQLYNPANPDKPIMVSPSRITAHEDNSYTYLFTTYPPHFANNMGEQISAGKPLLYANYMEMPKAANNRLVKSMEKADSELQFLVSTAIFAEWDRIRSLRTFLKDSLKELLLKELKFCETENVEQHFWRILYYNIIELLRKLMTDQPENKDNCKDLLIDIIDEGREYYEGLVACLETTFKVKFDRVNPMVQELTGFPALSLISAQKMFLFLGDLARYREQAFETSNYGQARQWYLKANQMNPKNGRPYNQLAILAFYTGRKIDAVYYYMRTLIASSPLASARESLVHIFDENRKKYEAEEKKKKEEKAARERERMREKEGSGGGLRREVWVHPGGRKNLHRTSTSSSTAQSYHSDLEILSDLPPSELNKRFSMCYLHVIGKIFTKIGLESLNETAMQMLREFRALMQHSPIQLKPTRFIQIMALNMFILEITQPKNEEMDSGYRSTLQESALVVSLEMFNIILERFIFLIGQDHLTDVSSLTPECLQLFPPIKVWCDWLITHVEVWNPPPSSQDFSIGAGNCWEKLACLVNILERMTQSCESMLELTHDEGCEFILLPENATLAGYTPLMANSEEPVFMRSDSNVELVQNCLRVHRLLFFGTVFLCGLDPPVLKLHKMESGAFHYISIVETTNGQEISEGEVFIESESESGGDKESDDSGKASGTEEEPSVPTQLRQLIETRQRLKSLARKQMNSHSQKQRLLKEQEIVVEMEIRPKFLLPDTNCFIDYLDLLSSIAKSHLHHPYIIMVPLVVVNELEGLSKVCKPGPSVSHAAHVKEAARAALQLIQERQPALKPVTTKGHILNSTTFIFEEDNGPEMKNDDKILATCLNLCRMNNKDDVTEGGKKKLYRDVVLLTEDRNLRLKALSRDVPVRELQDFVSWAGLG